DIDRRTSSSVERSDMVSTGARTRSALVADASSSCGGAGGSGASDAGTVAVAIGARGGDCFGGEGGCENIPAPTNVAAMPATTATRTTTLRLRPAIFGAAAGAAGAGAATDRSASGFASLSACGRRCPHRHAARLLGTLRAHCGQVQTNWSAMVFGCAGERYI